MTDAEPTPETTTQVLLVERPTGVPTDEHFTIETKPLEPLADGQVRIRTLALGIDAFIRTVLNDEAFHGSVPIGGVVSALGVGTVIESADERLAVGTDVFAPLGAQTIATLPSRAANPIDTSAVPAEAHLGALGMSTGITAWVGMAGIGQPGPDDTVVVSAAAGAVGSVAAQIARIAGARVIGIAGGPHKSAFLTDDLGLAAAIDYKNDDVGARLDELAPDGIDLFFDNVGNPTLDLVLDRIAERARVVICGAIAQYGNMDAVDGPSMYLRLAERAARMEGFTVQHHADRWGEAAAQLTGWLASGELVMRETVLDGIESFPGAIAMLFDGGNIGKLLVRP